MKLSRTALSEWGCIVSGMVAVGTALVWVFGIQPKGLTTISWFPAFSIVAALACAVLFYLGKMAPNSNTRVPSAPLANVSIAASDDSEKHQSEIFVLQVDGTQPLDNQNPDWRFFLTNCATRMLRSVKILNLRSEIEAYELTFHEIPVLQPGEKVTLFYEVLARRDDEKNSNKQPRLWDFATSHAGERGHTYIWYDLYVLYRDADDNTIRDGGIVGFCFDLDKKILKTEGAEHFRRSRERWKRLASF